MLPEFTLQTAMQVSLVLAVLVVLASTQAVYRTGLWAVNIQDIDLDGGQFEGDIVLHVRDENDTEIAIVRLFYSP